MLNGNKSYTFALCFALIAHGLKVEALEAKQGQHGEGLIVDGARFICTGYDRNDDGGPPRVLISCIDTSGYQIVGRDDAVGGVNGVKRMLRDFHQAKGTPEQPQIPSAVRDLLDRLGFKDYRVVGMAGIDLGGGVTIEDVKLDFTELTAEDIPDDFIREVGNIFIARDTDKQIILGYNSAKEMLTIDAAGSKFGLVVPKHRKYAEIYHYNTNLERRAPLNAEQVYTQFAALGGAVLADQQAGGTGYQAILANFMDRTFPQPAAVEAETEGKNESQPPAPVADPGISPEDAFTFTTTGKDGDLGTQEFASHGFDIEAHWYKGPLGYHVEVVARKGSVKLTGYDDFVRSPIDCECENGDCIAHYANEMVPYVIRAAQAKYASLMS